MVLELVMASKRHVKPSIRGVKMMKKQWFFKVFKVLHDFDMKLSDVSRGENVKKHKASKQNDATTTKGLESPAHRVV